eukprot:9288016-Alexandrium_andersonii.AAC.1
MPSLWRHSTASSAASGTGCLKTQSWTGSGHKHVYPCEGGLSAGAAGPRREVAHIAAWYTATAAPA